MLAYTYQAVLSDPEYFACYFVLGLLNLFTNWAACRYAPTQGTRPPSPARQQLTSVTSYVIITILSKSAEAIHRDTIRVLLR